MGHILIVILIVGLLSIGLKAVTKQRIQVSKDKVWEGKSTLLLGVPLLLIGVAVAGFWLFAVIS